MKTVCKFNCDNCSNNHWITQHFGIKTSLVCANEDRIIITSIVADEKDIHCRNYKEKGKEERKC